MTGNGSPRRVQTCASTRARLRLDAVRSQCSSSVCETSAAVLSEPTARIMSAISSAARGRYVWQATYSVRLRFRRSQLCQWWKSPTKPSWLSSGCHGSLSSTGSQPCGWKKEPCSCVEVVGVRMALCRLRGCPLAVGRQRAQVARLSGCIAVLCRISPTASPRRRRVSASLSSRFRMVPSSHSQRTTLTPSNMLQLRGSALAGAPAGVSSTHPRTSRCPSGCSMHSGETCRALPGASFDMPTSVWLAVDDRGNSPPPGQACCDMPLLFPPTMP